MSGTIKKIASLEQQIETMAGLGMAMSEICLILGVSKRTLERRVRKHKSFREALDRGRAKVNMSVAKKAYEMATSGEHERTTMFWLRSRNGWSETNNLNINGELKVKTLSELMEEIDKEEESENDL